MKLEQAYVLYDVVAGKFLANDVLGVEYTENIFTAVKFSNKEKAIEYIKQNVSGKTILLLKSDDIIVVPNNEE